MMTLPAKLLAAHRGETCRYASPPFALTLRVTDAGISLLEGAASADDVSCSVEFASPRCRWHRVKRPPCAAPKSPASPLLQDVSKALSSLPLAAEAELERGEGPILANEAALSCAR